jgi:hypothetical protein
LLRRAVLLALGGHAIHKYYCWCSHQWDIFGVSLALDNQWIFFLNKKPLMFHGGEGSNKISRTEFMV